MNKLCCCIICCATARVGPGKCQRCDKEMELCECGILARCGWVWGRGFVGSLAGHDLPFLVWLSCWFSAAKTPQVDLLLLFLCKTWDDTSARLIQSKAFDTLKTVFFFFLLCCVSYCIWNILFDPRWWCGYLIPAAHQELSHCCPNNWPGFKGVTTQGLKGK